ncbi:molybdenum cofactor cytidylyltransferase [Chitinophaga jiangningensis]|uniref:Molybdenum cofactor cytidylyltransferase n=1 Tax=Chitinophaga jiangningensis TaxID=1419482 RepID=A0A1M7MJL0_9BACT|nr:nucleotidyltransferase family protein [Chitinophaga jiangningensis]SHM91022.1 molybdenum cofactor cytidylyltransferase [Chitinophaga jiangningensis]
MTGIIILAAGASQRLGQPKQLLPFRGSTLLGKITSTAIESNIGPVLVTLGAFAEQVKPALASLHCKVTVNHHWEAGMGNTVAFGVTEFLRIYTNVSKLFLLVCDQPFIDARLLHRMQALRSPIVACRYEYNIGTPALFSEPYFAALQALQGSTGAKKLLTTHKDQVATIDFPEGIIDIDTIKDYHELLAQ